MLWSRSSLFQTAVVSPVRLVFAKILTLISRPGKLFPVNAKHDLLRMKIGALEIVIIVAVLLCTVVVWRWLADVRSDNFDDDYDEDDAENQIPDKGNSALRLAGTGLLLGGVAVVIISYQLIVGLASSFVWATIIIAVGLGLLFLSRR